MARIYVEQMGGWWSFSPDEFRALLDHHEDKHWNLDAFGRRLARRPACIHKHEAPDGAYYTVVEGNHLLFRTPCDWDAWQVQDAREQLELLN